MEKVKIDYLQEENIEDFLKLLREVILEDFTQYPRKRREFFVQVWTTKRVKERLKKKTRLFLVALENGEAIGLLIAKVWKGGGVSSLQWIGVKKEYREKGIGSALMQFWENVVKNRGCHKLRARTTEEETKDFYLKNGFELEGILKNDSYHLNQYFYSKGLPLDN